MNELDSISNKKINYDLYKLFETGDYKKLAAEISVTDDGSMLDLVKEENPIINNIDLIGISLIQSDKISQIFASLQGKHFSGKQVLSELVELIELYRKRDIHLPKFKASNIIQKKNDLKFLLTKE
ncbi:MAG: hypothetical protein MZV64_56635 [Ignavibacteriales bacterium]|nr:hypothetical protein [Ignavibacteriales bacterium]